MKKRTIFTLATIALTAIALICIFKYYHPTHFAYNDRFVIGNTQENITEKYGEFYRTHTNDDGDVTCGAYKIRDNTPELVMSSDDSLWYEIYFEDGVAVRVNLREGNAGG